MYINRIRHKKITPEISTQLPKSLWQGYELKQINNINEEAASRQKLDSWGHVPRAASPNPKIKKASLNKNIVVATGY